MVYSDTISIWVSVSLQNLSKYEKPHHLGVKGNIFQYILWFETTQRAMKQNNICTNIFWTCDTRFEKVSALNEEYVFWKSVFYVFLRKKFLELGTFAPEPFSYNDETRGEVIIWN